MRTSNRLLVCAIVVALGSAACSSSSKVLSGNGGSNFCEVARRETAAFSRPSSAAIPTAADMKKEFENIGPALQHAADIAPSAIKGDFQTFLNAFQPYLKALAAANFDFAKLNAASIQALTSPPVLAASAHIEQYFTQVCHITTPTT